ncbi:MAG: type VI secretion protein ImpB, partial [Pseudomonadota bacterium]
MRRPDTIECLYLDFDGFFASVMQQANPRLRGKPVGVVPFDVSKARYSCVIACSKEAKAQGVSNVMRVPDALKICPDLVLVEQRPDLFRRAHNSLLNEIGCVIPVETIKSIDELS